MEVRVQVLCRRKGHQQCLKEDVSTFAFRRDGSAGHSKTYKILVAICKLDFYFHVKERHVFRQLSLHERETADQFMARHCNFRTSLNNNLRDQLIEKLVDFELKRKLLEQRNITPEEALDKARAWEAAGRQATNTTMNPVVMDGDSVNAVKMREEKGDYKLKEHYNCGREGHLAIDRSCPAKGKKCAKCGRYGHFALCCQGKSDNYATGGKPDQRRRDSDRYQSYNANFVGDQDASDSEENCAFAFAVTMEEYEELKAQGLNAKMEDCHKRLYAYGGKELEVIGQVQDEISAGDKKISSQLVVTKSGRSAGPGNLKGYGTALD